MLAVNKQTSLLRTTLGLLSLTVLLGWGQTAQQPQHTGTVSILDGSRTVRYESISALNSDADIVVRGVATATVRVDTVGAVPFTITGLRVLQVLSGRTEAPVVEVRQLGIVGVHVVHSPPLLEPGRTYVLFLTRFHIRPGDLTGEYVVTGGGAGAFEERGRTLVRLDPDAIDLPSAISLPRLLAGLAPGAGD